MFLKYIDFVFAPFRAIQNKWIGVKNIKGNIQVDINRSKALVNRGKQAAGQVSQFNQQAGGAPLPGAQPAQGQAPQGYAQPGQQGAYMQQPQMPGMPPGMPGAPGAPGAAPLPPGAPNPNPPLRVEGMWFWKKKFCTQCQGCRRPAGWRVAPWRAKLIQSVPALGVSGGCDDEVDEVYTVPIRGASR